MSYGVTESWSTTPKYISDNSSKNMLNSNLYTDTKFTNMKLSAEPTDAEKAMYMRESLGVDAEDFLYMTGVVKFDIKTVNQVAKKLGMDTITRKAFGDYIESYKYEVGKPNNVNFSWKELIEIGKEFLGQ